MTYSTAGANPSQVNSVDADGILRLYTDSVAAYVENQDAHALATVTNGNGRRAGDSHRQSIGPINSPLKCVEVGPVLPVASLKVGPDTATWEDARRARATRLGVPSNYLEIPDSSSGLQPDTDCLRTDGELMRMCGIGFKHAPAYQRWVILNDMNRETGQQGYTFADLEARLTEHGVKGGTVYNRRIIRKGIGFYWDYDPRTDKIFPTGYVELTQRALQYAHDLGLHDLYASGNHPGQQRFMYVSVKGSSADFEGACLEAWCAAHNCPTITRFTLRHLFNRDRRSFWKLEKRTGIRVIPNEAETTDPSAVPLDSNGNPRGDVRHNGRGWRYRMANTYQPITLIRQHHKRGQSRRAAYSFKQWFASIELHTNCQGKVSDNFRDLVKLNPTGRTYCNDDKAAGLSRKRGNTATLYVRCKPGRGRGVVWTVHRLDDNM